MKLNLFEKRTFFGFSLFKLVVSFILLLIGLLAGIIYFTLSQAHKRYFLNKKPTSVIGHYDNAVDLSNMWEDINVAPYSYEGEFHIKKISEIFVKDEDDFVRKRVLIGNVELLKYFTKSSIGTNKIASDKTFFDILSRMNSIQEGSGDSLWEAIKFHIDIEFLINNLPSPKLDEALHSFEKLAIRHKKVIPSIHLIPSTELPKNPRAASQIYFENIANLLPAKIAFCIRLEPSYKSAFNQSLFNFLRGEENQKTLDTNFVDYRELISAFEIVSKSNDFDVKNIKGFQSLVGEKYSYKLSLGIVDDGNGIDAAKRFKKMNKKLEEDGCLPISYYWFCPQEGQVELSKYFIEDFKREMKNKAD